MPFFFFLLGGGAIAERSAELQQSYPFLGQSYPFTLPAHCERY